MLTILAPLLLSAPQVSESWTATGPIGEPFGQVVASAGHRAWEIARQEILVGSPLQDGAGQLTILSPFGSTSLFFEGPIPGSLLGYAVADAGDLDGDGLAEFFVSPHPGKGRTVARTTTGQLERLNGAADTLPAVSKLREASGLEASATSAYCSS